VTRQFHPHAARTAPALAARLAELMPARGIALELASGSGQLIVELAALCPALTWIGSERDRGALASIASWRDAAGLANLAPPIELDVRARPWPVEAIDVAIAVRLIHVLAPAELAGVLAAAVERGARRVIVVGPFATHAVAPSCIPVHLADWVVPIRIPTRDELAAAAAAAGLRSGPATAPVHGDEIVVLDAIAAAG